MGDQSERGGGSLSLSTDSAEECRPELVLKGHTKEGYESWSSLTLSLEFCHFQFTLSLVILVFLTGLTGMVCHGTAVYRVTC